MSHGNGVDYEIIKAIAEELKDRSLDGTPYANKLEKTIVNKLVSKFHESDLLDLIEDIPTFAWDKER